MKKFFLILAIIGFGFSAKAQMCVRADGVQPSIETYDTGKVEYWAAYFYNSNDTRVTVDVIVTIVFNDGKEPEVFTRTLVIKPNSNDLVSKGKAMVNTGIRKDARNVNIRQSKAEVLDCTKYPY